MPNNPRTPAAVAAVAYRLHRKEHPRTWIAAAEVVHTSTAEVHAVVARRLGHMRAVGFVDSHRNEQPHRRSNLLGSVSLVRRGLAHHILLEKEGFLK